MFKCINLSFLEILSPFLALKTNLNPMGERGRACVGGEVYMWGVGMSVGMAVGMVVGWCGGMVLGVVRWE